MKGRKIGECVYCGTRGPITQDHVPLKGLFPKPRPNTLITVPSCVDCNLDSSVDDEYFRAMLALRADLTGNPAVEKIRETVLRSFEKPTKEAFRQSFYGSLESVVPDSQGKTIGVGGQTYPVAVQRISWVVGCTTLGLFHKHMGRRLPLGEYVAGANLAVEIDFEGSDILTMGRQRLLAAPERVVASDVYSYRFIELEFDSNCTVWWHTFYGIVDLIAATMPARVADGGGEAT